MHSTSNLEDGYLGSGLILRRSIRKYGKENFKLEIIKFYKDKDELIQAEKNLITEDIVKEPLCMNLMKGGKGGFISDEQQKYRAQCARKALGKKLNDDKEFAKEFSKKLTASLINQYELGLRVSALPNWSGKTHNEETKVKIGLSNKKNHIGELNGNFGKCWVTKENKNIMIKKEELQTYLITGWIKGRKI